jgi:hypothetical protein
MFGALFMKDREIVVKTVNSTDNSARTRNAELTHADSAALRQFIRIPVFKSIMIRMAFDLPRALPVKRSSRQAVAVQASLHESTRRRIKGPIASP